MDVSVVIPNYNTWELVRRNVDALLRYDSNYISEIIVVDDCSPTPNYIHFDQRVQVLRNEVNVHYTRTVNRGLRKAKGDIIVLLDSDAYPIHSFMEQLLLLYTKDRLLGCVGFKTVNEKGEDTGNVLAEPSVFSLISGQQIHALLRKYNVFESKRLLPFSCAVSFRKQCLEELGYFDEQFPVVEADHDISMRIYRSRWKLIYEPSIAVVHVGGGSIANDSKRVLLFYEYRWRLLCKFQKTGPVALVMKIILLRLWLEAWVLKIYTIIHSTKEMYIKKYKGRIELIQLIRNLKNEAKRN